MPDIRANLSAPRTSVDAHAGTAMEGERGEEGVMTADRLNERLGELPRPQSTVAR